MAEKAADFSDVILSRANQINYVIVAALGIIVIVALTKLARKKEISIQGVSIKISYLQWVMAGFTIAHFYASYSFNMKIREVLQSHNQIEASDAFNKLRDSGPLFFQGLIARLHVSQGPFGPVFLMDPFDPSTLLAHGAAVGAFLVMLRWSGIRWYWRFLSVLGSAIIVIANWLIGGGWAVHASCLSNESLCRSLFGL